MHFSLILIQKNRNRVKLQILQFYINSKKFKLQHVKSVIILSKMVLLHRHGAGLLLWSVRCTPVGVALAACSISRLRPSHYLATTPFVVFDTHALCVGAASGFRTSVQLFGLPVARTRNVNAPQKHFADGASVRACGCARCVFVQETVARGVRLEYFERTPGGAAGCAHSCFEYASSARSSSIFLFLKKKTQKLLCALSRKYCANVPQCVGESTTLQKKLLGAPVLPQREKICCPGGG